MRGGIDVERRNGNHISGNGLVVEGMVFDGGFLEPVAHIAQERIVFEMTLNMLEFIPKPAVSLAGDGIALDFSKIDRGNIDVQENIGGNPRLSVFDVSSLATWAPVSNRSSWGSR